MNGNKGREEYTEKSLELQAFVDNKVTAPIDLCTKGNTYCRRFSLMVLFAEQQ
jgi:hypothetical protein